MNKEEKEQIISNNNSATEELKKYLEGSTKPLKKYILGILYLVTLISLY